MRIVVVLALALVFGACTKDRPVEFSQNVGENLQSVSDYNGYEFTVKTGEAYSSGSTISSAELNGGIDREISLLNSFPLVSYTTEGDKLNIFRDIPFRARPGATYTFRYKVHHDMVMVYQISKKEDIPGPLFTSARKIGEDLYEVPYAYKPISLHKVEHVEDRNKEETTTLGEFSAYDVSDATHFRVQNVPPRLYEPESKVDVLPADLFTGEWFYAVTLTKASADQAGSVGQQAGSDFAFQPASRVRFETRRDRVRAVNTNIDDQVDDSDDLNLKSAIEFPVKRLNYRMKKIGAGAGQQEEKIYADHAEAPAWQDLKYIEVDFTEVMVPRMTGLQNNSELHNFTIAKDFFSFDLEFKQQNLRFKFAFKRAHDPIKGIGYPKDDRKIYGFFTGQKNFINNYKIERAEDYEKNIFLSRYYPKDGVIEYYLSDLTPRSFYPVARRAVEIWDDAFQRAGTNIRIKLNETQRVAVGDIRYNVINLIKNVDTDGGGYGPQLADFNSGEIISSTANVHTGYYTNQIIETARNYIRSKLGVFNEVYVGYGPEWGTFMRHNTSNGVMAYAMMDDIFSDKVGKAMQELGANNQDIPSANRLIERSKLAELLGRHRNSNFIETGDGGKIIIPVELGELSRSEQGRILDNYFESVARNEIPAGSTLHYDGNNSLYNERFGHRGEESYIASTRRLLTIVKQYCEDDINEYVEDIKARNISYDSDKELALVEKCKEASIGEAILGTVLHEMGHNFGLRHNFFGATDVENFPLGTDNVNEFGLSSIMDYMGAAKVDKLGNYDVAAIRYGYARKAESKNGLIDILPGKSILESAKALSKDFVKKYKYCTDEDINIFTAQGAVHAPVDPMCARHQFGATPLEVVTMASIDYDSFNAIYGKRFDRANGPIAGIVQRNFVGRIGMPMLTMYNQWRWHLKNFMEAFDPVSQDAIDRIKKKSSGYLENITTAEFDMLIDAMKNDKGSDGKPSKHAKAFAEYYEAGQAAYAFFKNLITIPSKYCAVKASEDAVNYDLLSFYNVRQKMYKDDGAVVATCEEAADLGYFAEKNLNLVGSLGEYYGSITSELDIQDPNSNRVDILGYQYASASALALLSMRAPTTREMILEDFKPNFLDNPHNRTELQALILNRMSLGVHSSELSSKYIVEPSEVVDEEIIEFAAQEYTQVKGRLQTYAMQRDSMSKELAEMNSELVVTEERIAAAKAAATEPAVDNSDDSGSLSDDATDSAVEAKKIITLTIDGDTVSAEFTNLNEGDAAAVMADLEETVVEATATGMTLEQLETKKSQLETEIKALEAEIAAIQGSIEAFSAQVVSDLRTDYIKTLQDAGKFYPFFAEKQDILLGQFGMFIQGLAHPKKPELTLDRMQLFTTVKDPQEIRSIRGELSEDEYAFVQYGPRQYLAKRSENVIMYNMIKEAQRLESVREDAINGVGGELIEDPILGQVITLFFPSLDELKQMPLRALQTYVASKAQAFQMLAMRERLSQGLVQQLFNYIIPLMQPYLQFAQVISQNLTQLEAQGVTNVYDAMIIMGNSEESIKGLTKSAVPQIIEGLRKDVVVRREKATNYNKNFEEYEAQRNILSTVILSL